MGGEYYWTHHHLAMEEPDRTNDDGALLRSCDPGAEERKKRKIWDERWAC